MKEKVRNCLHNKKFWRGICLTAAIVSGLRLVIEAVLYLLVHVKFYWNMGNAASVGIIGGADGPTAIFLTTSFGPVLGTTAAVIVFAVSLLLYIRLRRQK